MKILNISNEAEMPLDLLKEVVDNKLHKSSIIGRGDLVNKSILFTLCDWFFENPEDLEETFKAFQARPDFPASNIKWTSSIRKDEIWLASFIIDFVSMLTDDEVRMISCTYPRDL